MQAFSNNNILIKPSYEIFKLVWNHKPYETIIYEIDRLEAYG